MQKVEGSSPFIRVRRPVVHMQLPLEGLATSGEQTHLPRDQLIKASAIESFEVAIANKPTVVQTEETRSGPSRSTVTSLGSRSGTCARS